MKYEDDKSPVHQTARLPRNGVLPRGTVMIINQTVLENKV